MLCGIITVLLYVHRTIMAYFHCNNRFALHYQNGPLKDDKPNFLVGLEPICCPFLQLRFRRRAYKSSFCFSRISSSQPYTMENPWRPVCIKNQHRLPRQLRLLMMHRNSELCFYSMNDISRFQVSLNVYCCCRNDI